MSEPADNMQVGLPREIGGYRILRVLGSGRMATVYAAQQQSPRRVVALKVMKAAIASHAESGHGSEHRAARRFKREVQILGKLRHRWIAQVFEAGTHDDGSGAVPFFAMEYIPGARTLLEFAAWKDLSLRDRLKLFVKVCSAVQHGHAARIIHRDLKPANILVDEHGEPKVIDFGVAQAADVDLSMQTMHTEVGRLIGTIQYMSPEQVDGRPRNLTPESDVYALGVLLFRLVCLKMPYDLEALPIHEASRVICTEAPRSPSSIRTDVRGDLETIILKALEKQPQRRYPNAGSLGRDIVRFLASKPIHARRAGMLYRAALFLQRHRAAAVFSIAALALIAASIVVTAILASRGYSIEAATPNSRPQGAAIEPPSVEPADGSASNAPRNLDARAVADLQQFRLAEHVNAITGLAIDPARGMLYSAGLDHRVVVWDLQSRQPLHRIDDHAHAAWRPRDDHEAAITAMALSDDASLLVTADEDGVVIVRDAQTFEPLDHKRVAHEAVNAIDISPDHRLIAASADDLTMRLWNLRHGRLRLERGDLQTLRGTDGAFQHAAFDAGGGRLAAASARGPVYVFDVAKAELDKQLSGLASAAVALAWLEQSTQLAAVSPDGRVCVWDTADGDIVREFVVESAAAWTPSAASGRTPPRAAGTPRPTAGAAAEPAAGTSRSHESAVNLNLGAAAIDPNCRFLAGGVSNIEVFIWSLSDGKLIRAVTTSDRASFIAFARDSSSIVIGEESGDIAFEELMPDEHRFK